MHEAYPEEPLKGQEEVIIVRNFHKRLKTIIFILMKTSAKHYKHVIFEGMAIKLFCSMF